MKQLFLKEIFSYFKSKFFYAMMFVYAVLSMICCFYFGNFFEIATSNLASLFYFQPNIFAFVIPAIAVRLWSEERKSNTIELLVSLPISLRDIVLAKFFSCYTLGVFLLVLTLPFLIFASCLLDLDYLSIVSSYFACLLVLFSVCALCCLSASFFVNTAVSYLMSLFVVWIFFLPAFSHNFVDVLYGQISFDNVLYFLIVGCFAINANLYLVKNKFEKNKKLFYFMIMQFASAFLLIFVTNFLFSAYKLDFTYSKTFSLSDEAKKVLKSFDEPVIVDVYASDWREFSPKKAEYINNVVRFLNKIPNATVNVKNIKPFSKEETEAIDFGLDFVETAKYNLYAGIVLTANENKIVVNSINPEDAIYLEADVVRAINSLNKKNRKILGIVAGNPKVVKKEYGLFRGETWPFVNELNKHYRVAMISEKEVMIPKIDILLVVNNPQSYVIKYAIDQYLMRGGKVLVVEDKMGLDYKNKTSFVADNMKMFAGDLSSAFDANIVEDSALAARMLPYLPTSINNSVLIISDENILGDVNEIAKEDLFALLNTLDYLSDDKNMFNVSFKKEIVEEESIKDKLENKYSVIYLPKVDKIRKEIDVLRADIIAMNSKSLKILANYQRVVKLDKKMNEKQTQAKELAYLIEDKATRVVFYYIILNTFVLPFLLVLLLMFVFEFLRKKYVKV